MQIIKGIGTDIVSVQRFRLILGQSYKDRFISKVLHLNEINELNIKTDIE